VYQEYLRRRRRRADAAEEEAEDEAAVAVGETRDERDSRRAARQSRQRSLIDSETLARDTDIFHLKPRKLGMKEAAEQHMRTISSKSPLSSSKKVRTLASAHVVWVALLLVRLSCLWEVAKPASPGPHTGAEDTRQRRARQCIHGE
jgi:hypothetical protein